MTEPAAVAAGTDLAHAPDSVAVHDAAAMVDVDADANGHAQMGPHPVVFHPVALATVLTGLSTARMGEINGMNIEFNLVVISTNKYAIFF